MSSLGRIASRSTKRRQYFESCGNAVRKLAVQARLWKMAPDEMDTRYESLLRRCAATEKRFQTTTVSDILARISDTLKSTENQRNVTSPDLIPCDLTQDAEEDALVSLEDDPTIDQHVDNNCLYLGATKPAVITIISPSTTSLSSSAEESYVKLKKARTNNAEIASPVQRPHQFRQMRRTDASSVTCYPRMSWKRAHQVVQSRKRCSKRKRSPYTRRRPPLETNPGWTPLQKAILKSGILRSPAPLPFICPDSPQSQPDRQVTNHQNNEHLIGNLEKKNAIVENVDYSLQIATQMHTERVPTCTDYESPAKHGMEAPSTPEVIISRRRNSESRSESAYSDFSRCRSDEDENPHDEIPSSGSLDDPDEYWSPTETSTPICSAMKLLLHAEPFVPNMNKINNPTSSDPHSSMKQHEAPLNAQMHKIPGNDATSLKVDQSVSRNVDVDLNNNIQDLGLKTNNEKSEAQSQIPVIIHGVIKEKPPESTISKNDNVIDVKPTQSWIVSTHNNKAQSPAIQARPHQMNPQNQGAGVVFPQGKTQGNIHHQQQPLLQTPTLPTGGLVLVPLQHAQQVAVQPYNGLLQQTHVQRFPMQSGRPVQQHRQQQMIPLQQQWHLQQQQQRSQQPSNMSQLGMNQLQRQVQQPPVWNTQQIQMQRTQYQPFQRQVANIQQHHIIQQQQQQHVAYRQQNQQQVGNRVLPWDTPGGGRVPLSNFSAPHQQHAGFNNNNYHQRQHAPPQNYQLQQPVRPRFPNSCGTPSNRPPLLNTPPIRNAANTFHPPFHSSWQGRY